MSNNSNSFSVTGEIVNVTEIIHGEGKRGPYKIQQILIRYSARNKYTNHIALNIWDSLTAQFETGQLVTAHFTIEHHANNGRYNNNLSAYQIDVLKP